MYFELHLKRGRSEWEGAVCFCDGLSGRQRYIAQPMQQQQLAAGRGSLKLLLLCN